jgi:hypothetical protein
MGDKKCVPVQGSLDKKEKEDPILCLLKDVVFFPFFAQRTRNGEKEKSFED